MAELETAKMSKRGQVIIPKEIREAMGAQEDSTLAFMPLDSNRILLTKVKRENLIKEFDRIRESIKNKITDEEVLDIIQEVRRKKRTQQRNR